MLIGSHQRLSTVETDPILDLGMQTLSGLSKQNHWAYLLMSNYFGKIKLKLFQAKYQKV